MDVVTVSLLLKMVAAFLATSLTLGSALGVALGAMIRRAERRHQQDVALLLRSRGVRGRVGSTMSTIEQTAREVVATGIGPTARRDAGCGSASREPPRGRRDH
jgi:hypothetical protein